MNRTTTFCVLVFRQTNITVLVDDTATEVQTNFVPSQNFHLVTRIPLLLIILKTTKPDIMW